jgi:hypothetical protein
VASAHQKRTPRRLFPLIMQLRMSITQPKRLFREKFGREPGPEDPLFFNLVSSVPEFLNAESQDETWRALVQAAGESGMDPALVYAMNKTGRIVTEHNMRFLTDSDIQEWNDAVPLCRIRTVP